MSCEVYRPALTDVALGLAVPPALEAHLRACAPCRALLDEDRRLLGRIDGEVEAALQVAPSAGFLPRVRQRVEEPPPAVRGGWRWWLVPAAAAATTALFLLRRPSPAPIPRPAPPVAAEVTPREVSPAAPAVPPTPVPVRRAAVVVPAEPEVLIPPGEREALTRYLEDLRRQRTVGFARRTVGLLAADGRGEMPPDSFAPLPTQAAVTPIDPVPAPEEIDIGPIRIALIGVQPLTMDFWNEE